MTSRDVFGSCDFIIAAVITAVLIICLPKTLPAAFTKEIYGVAISALSVLFSVFFAAFATIITNSEDEFARFLEEEGHYKAILSTFKVTVFSLFLALALAVLLFALDSYRLSLDGNALAYKCHMVVFSFVGLYALLASAVAVKDSVKYVEYRSEYLRLKDDLHRMTVDKDNLAGDGTIGQTARRG